MLPRKNSHIRSVLFGYAGATGVVALVAALAMPAEGVGVTMANFWWIALASIAVIGSLMARAGVWSATGAYAAVFWCFHFGLVAVLASGLLGPMDLSIWDRMWALGPFGADAALLALMGSLAFASGASLVLGCRSSNLQLERSLGGDEAAHPHGTAGSVLVFAAIAVWCFIVVTTGGTGGFFGSYADYLQATVGFGSEMTFVWLSVGCGIVMSVTGRPGWLRTSTIVAFGSMAMIALPIGLRGEVMFPAIAALVAAARCGRALSHGRALAFVLILLVLIPVVREVRHTGLNGLPEVVFEPRLLDAFVEMGGSLHPVEKVLRWRAEGDAFEKGGSYWAPIERAAARVLPGMKSAAADDDMRIMNVLVLDRVGPIGFSPVAEAYRNFGAVGVVLVLGLLGAALGAIDTIHDRRMAVLAIATIYVPLLTNVRNSFISVPVQCAVGILFVLGLSLIRHMMGSVLCKPYARSPHVRSEI